MLIIQPITLRKANEYVKKNHRHHSSVTGCRFAISCYDNDRLCGVAICGRPVSRYLDNGLTLEINRLCTDGTPNACSKLYGACSRIAKEMGYNKVITYTLASENGASCKAANFIDEGVAGGIAWTGKRSGHDNGSPKQLKRKFSLTFERG